MNPAPPDVPWRALAAFRYRIRVFLSRSERAARGIGLEPQQHHLLLAIRAARETADPTIGSLAAELLLKHHSVVGLVDRLQARGLVSRHSHPADRRQVCVRLTREGEALLAQLTGALLEEYRTMGPEIMEALRIVLGTSRQRGAAPARAARRTSVSPESRAGAASRRRTPAAPAAAARPRKRSPGP